MSASQETLKAKMRARRRKLEDTTVDGDGPDASPRRPTVPDHTWAAASDDPLPGSSEDRMEMTEEMKDEVDAARLKRKLEKKRRKTEAQLEHDLAGKDGDDAVEQIKIAKRKTQQKVIDEANRSATEGEETAASAAETDDNLESLRIPELAEDDGGVIGDGESSSRPTSRSPRRMLSDGTASKSDKRMSKALNLSIRAKLSEKMRVAKDKAKDEAYDESKATGRRLAHKRDTLRTTRFDDPDAIKKDMEAYEALEKSITLRNKWKQAAHDGKDKFMPSKEEAFDFFTRVWEPEPEEPKSTKQEATGKDGDETEVKAAAEFAPGTSAEGVDREAAEAAEAPKEPKDEDAEQKGKEGKAEDEEALLGDLDAEEDSWRYYHISKADYIPHQKQLDEESKIYFYPSILEAPINEKIFEQEEPRFLEDEGFYVGTKPPVANRNVCKMENRLLKEGEPGHKWFGEDGKLIALPDPLKETPERPPIWEEMIPELETVYKKAMMSQLDSRYIQPVSDVQSHYQLDVDVNTVSFTHHHLFSREHVLAAKLTDQYQQYLSRSRKKLADLLTQKLKALKLASSHLQNTVAAAEAERKPPAGLREQKQRLEEYYLEIRQTRQQRDDELLADRTLLKHIIKTWRDIKSLRQFQKCTNTSVKLQITKEPSNKEADQAQWDEDLEDELADVKLEEERRYQEYLQLYRTELEDWKKQKLLKKEAQKREKQRSRKQSRGTDEDDRDALLQSEKDQELLGEDNLPKPEKPQITKESEMREKILSKYREIRRKPGEPRLYPELSSGATVTPNNQCPRGEQQRRNDVNRSKLYARVLFNEKEVGRTATKALGIDFTVHFTQIFNIEILQWPQSIKLEIVETSGLSSTVLSEVYMAVPEANVTADNMQLDEVEFSSYERISHSHEGVGSGVPFSFEADRSNMMSLMTTGTLSTGAAWACDDEGNVLVPPTSSQLRQHQTAAKGLDAVAAIGMAGMADMDKLNEWIKKSHLDPNDPNNAELMYLLRPVAGGDTAIQAMQLPTHYRLEQLLEEFSLTTDEELEESKRFRMISLREKEEPHFRHKQVPAFDKEIPDEVFLEYEKEKEKQEKISKLDEGSHRAAVAQFMQKVREQVILRFRIAAHQKLLSDIVYEEAVPNISNIIPSLVKIAEPRRPLKPIRKERKKITAQNLQGVDVKILVNVVRAFDIPVRSEAMQTQAQGRGAQQAAGGPQREGAIRNIAGETLVRPFIEVMFQRNVETTSVADGPNPSWNEELQLPFKAPNNDYSTTNLQTVNDIIYINLFDEYVVDMVTDDRDRGTSIHRRIEKRWLGSFKVPFSTVYFNSRIDGTFRIRKPPVLLGYTQDTGGTKLDTGFDIGMGSGEYTYLTMFITVEPALVPPEAVREKFDSSEEEKLLVAADKWQFEVEKKFPKREYKTTVVDINGKSVFLTRYFKPLKPPEVLINGQESPEATAKAVARYVAMIPFVSDSVVFPGMCDIWSTCDQFLSMLQGDEEEHAVLLTNYFLHLGKEAWLLLGSAVPEGPTAYVLTKEGPKQYLVWNASTGECYNYRDNYCPVQSVGCLVNQHNVWANVQAYEQPSQVSFDLNNTSFWKPFFSKSYPHPGFSSVQPDNLLYVETSKSEVIQIQEKIERTLKDKIMNWRPRNITRWNRYCVSAFRKLLEKLEGSQGKGIQEEHSHELEQILGSYKMCGFPINLPYTEVEPIIDSVYATGVHNNETNDVEFAVAVHIHPYPNNVLSVWVYVASLVRKR